MNLKLALIFAVVSSLALAQSTAVKVQKGKVEVTGSDGQAVKVETDEEKDDDADGFSVAGQGLSQAHACRADEDVEISGQGNTVTLTGPCRKVSLTGQGHVVTVDVVGTIEVSGMGNSVTWKTALKGKKPTLSVTGVKNAVKQAK